MKNIKRIFWSTGLAAMTLLLSGCVTSILARQMVKAPNRQGMKPQSWESKEALAGADSIYTLSCRVPVGPPTAELAVSVVESGDYRFTYDIKENVPPEGGGTLDMKFDAKPPESPAERVRLARAPKATLVLLHGYMATKETMLFWTFFFAEKGYRVVLVDLRGHGKSTGKWIGFGRWEADDLVKVTDELQRRGLIVGKLGIFGSSYGAVVGIHWAAHDPRVASVVALAPYRDPQAAIPVFARGIDPKRAGKLSDTTFAEAEAKAATLAGFAWQDVNVEEAMKRVRVPVLFFHGGRDHWVPPMNTESLVRVAPVGSQREVTPYDDHRSLIHRFDLIGAPALAWFDEHLKAEELSGAK